MTSGQFSTLSLLHHNKSSGEIYVRIQLYDVLNRRKTVGGDVVIVRAQRIVPNVTHQEGQPKPSRSRNLYGYNFLVSPGTVVDHENGSYTAVVRTFWSEKTRIVAVVASKYQNICRRLLSMAKYGQSVFALPRPRGIAIEFRQGYLSEYTMCSALPNVVGHENICNLTNRNFGMSFYCGHPVTKSLTCDDTILLARTRYFDNNVTQVHNSSKVINPLVSKIENEIVYSAPYLAHVVNGFVLKHRPRDTCTAVLPIKSWFDPYPASLATSSGWKQLHCTHTLIRGTKNFRKCLAGKQIYTMGDSTVRQYFDYIVDKLRSSETKQKERNSLVFDDRQLNVYGEWTIHSMPYSCGDSVGLCIPNSLAQTLQRIREKKASYFNGSEIIILITYHAHLQAYPVSVFRNRLQSLITPIRLLKKQFPMAKIFFKGPHPISINGHWFDVRNALIFRDVLFETFKPILDLVVYLDTFSISVSYASWELHPNGKALQAQIDQWLSYIC